MVSSGMMTDEMTDVRPWTWSDSDFDCRPWTCSGTRTVSSAGAATADWARWATASTPRATSSSASGTISGEAGPQLTHDTSWRPT